ncbi:hypothetical protein [Paraburkholderia sp. BL10I2N1]|uniref:hypothetical protein n=1 Tax=Paraburkholderia sp. BL10I2N1 TaxID=1938796 RepID=UPI0010CEE665|nr:hypothetical protein [Paraburkholderia sp. BL10I2N1]TDN69438.1 hypothetical protein B0G77_2823 [Paraburkholderia sp. BL10I2N1]
MNPVSAAAPLAGALAMLSLTGCYYPYGYYPYGYYPGGAYYATVPESAAQHAVPVAPADTAMRPSTSAQQYAQGYTQPALVAEAPPPVYTVPAYPAYPYYQPYPVYAPYPAYPAYYGWPALSIGFGYYWGGHGGFHGHHH